MIEIHALTRRFGNKEALENVDLRVESGSIMGVIGSNGAGKSTLLRILSGIYRPDEGSVYIDGEEVYENVAVKGRIYFVSDQPYLEAGATLKSMAGQAVALYPRFSQEKYERLSRLFRLDAKQKLSTMSKGMQRQAVLVTALSTMPDYLLLDEVFDGLDPVMRKLVKRVLAGEVAERRMTVLIASHNLRDMEDFCDTVCLLHRGSVLLEKETDELRLDVHRIQVIFRTPMEDAQLRELFNPLSVSRTGSLYTLVVRGAYTEIEKKLASVAPQFSEFLPISLEEIFIREMEAVGYDFEEALY